MKTHHEVSYPAKVFLLIGCSMLLLNGSAILADDLASVNVELVVESGIDASGRATDLWLAILKRRLSADAYQKVSDIQKPLEDEERKWELLIRSRLEAWSRVLPAVAELYEPAAPPDRVVIVLGNRGAHDAFTHDPATMGFDLAALIVAYGSAASEENTERIDRLFTHEFAHLMQKSWVRDHPYDAATPLRAALRGIWLEGLGNYHSMSAGWRADAGVPSPKAAAALSRLEPRFCARLAALACGGDENADSLTADLSMGRFDRKWGALTAALWVEQEMSTDPDAYRRLVEAGPDAILDMARKHLSGELASVIDEAVLAEELCR